MFLKSYNLEINMYCFFTLGCKLIIEVDCVINGENNLKETGRFDSETTRNDHKSV